MSAAVIDTLPLPGAADAPEREGGAAMARARLCHFFELALAHPASDGLACFRAPAIEQSYRDALSEAVKDVELRAQAAEAGARFFAALRAHDDAQVESAHIALFSAGFPTLPCPPYGSLFTVQGDKRLEEMRRIKEFYQRHGFDLDDAFTDLPDHLCVELEFMQALCFREHDARSSGDAAQVAEARAAQAQFLDAFLLPFVQGIANAARVQKTPNIYVDLLAAVDACASGHRRALAATDDRAH